MPDDAKPRRDPPWPLRIPKEWKPEIGAAANRLGISQHAWLVKAIRRVLDGERLDKVSAPLPPNRFVRDVIAEKCKHPINRRIGTGCGACGKDPV